MDSLPHVEVPPSEPCPTLGGSGAWGNPLRLILLLGDGEDLTDALLGEKEIAMGLGSWGRQPRTPHFGHLQCHSLQPCSEFIGLCNEF